MSTALNTGEAATRASDGADNQAPLGVQGLTVKTLGTPKVASPMAPLLENRQTTEHYVDETDRVLLDDTLNGVTGRGVGVEDLPGLEPCGPRRKIFFDPSKTRAAIVTCGGLCPGLNDVIAGLVRNLTYHYKVRRIIGIKNGYQGFIPSYGHDVVDLTPATVRDISVDGGTVLGTSRGHQDPEEIVDCLERLNINMLFVIGGDGSMRGAMEIVRVVTERGLRIAVVGIPKTIDNDIPLIDQSFGFQTAFSLASDAIRAARVEAKSTANGVGLVRLMGRHSGFIACYAALARSDADVVLIPEVPFALDGPHGLLEHVRQRVADRGNAVVVVAEGAGQDLWRSPRAATRRGTRSCATSGRSCAHGWWSTSRRRASRPPSATSTRATPSAASRRTPTTASTACGCRRPRCTPRCPGAPRWWSGAGGGGSCTCRWRWR
jgi:6-phosphofructokinase 1